jgi:phosphatidate cytidylyltransferase
VKPGAAGCPVTTPQPGGTSLFGRHEAFRRILATIVFAPLFYLVVRYLPPAVFFVLVSAAALLTVGELFRLLAPKEQWPISMGLGGAATLALLCDAQWPALIPDRLILLVTVLVAAGLPLVSPIGLRDAVMQSALAVMGALYVGLTLSCLLLTRALPDGEYLVFFVVLVTWAGDTGAYIVGKLMGRRPLAPIISPKKTIEGLFGGMILAVVVALGSRSWFLPSLHVRDAAVLGVLLTLAGLLGDLAESAIKRGANQKDSGSLIPGHGGMLDRLDSLLFTAPCFYYYVAFVRGS